jgi:signal transduction histidine kinase
MSAESQREAEPAAQPVLPAKYWFPLLVAVVVSGAILVVSELSYRDFFATRGHLEARMAIQLRLTELHQALSQAEASQRAYLLTLQPRHLEPFRSSAAQLRIAREQLRDLVVGDQAARDKVGELNELITLKYAELERGADLAVQGDFAGAQALLEGDEGRSLAMRIESSFAGLRRLAAEGVAASARGWEESMDSSRSGILTVVGLNAVLIAMLSLVLIRDVRRAREAAEMHATFAERMTREVQDRTGRLSALSEFLQTQSEQEKAKLARELHDELGGILTPAKMDVNWLQGRLGSDPESSERLSRLAKLLDSGIDVKRRIIENLRPSLLDHLGLAAALRSHVEEACRAAGLELHLEFDERVGRLTPEIEIALYRVIQESVTNVVRHARARNVELKLARNADGVAVSVRDDGAGIADVESAARRSYGIGGIRQRMKAVHGIVEIDSAPGRGTTVRAFVPLPGDAR